MNWREKAQDLMLQAFTGGGEGTPQFDQAVAEFGKLLREHNGTLTDLGMTERRVDGAEHGDQAGLRNASGSGFPV